VKISRRDVMIGAGGVIAASSTASYARLRGDSPSAPSEALQLDGRVSKSNHSDLVGLLAMVRGGLAEVAKEKTHADV
jgi:hypothetical protein